MLREVSAWSVSIQSELIMGDSRIYLHCYVIVIRRPSLIHGFVGLRFVTTNSQYLLLRHDSSGLFLCAHRLAVVRNSSLLIARVYVFAVPVDEGGLVYASN